MKAVVFNEHGGPEVLEYTSIPDPEMKDNQVLIEVKAVALNHLDLFVRGGLPGLNLEMPHILGSDIAGRVKEISPGVSKRLEEGQMVVVDPGVSCGTCEFCITGQESLCADYGIIGEHCRGGYAELFAIDAQNIITVPEASGLDYTQAAAVPLTFMTAWRLLVTKAQICPGEDVLIIGIGGGVATAALQIAKLAGARVIVTSSSDTKLDRAGILGADYGINYTTTPDYHKEIRRMTSGRGVDVVLDSVGAATWDKSLRSLRKGGRLVTPGATSGAIVEVNANRVFWNQLEILGSTMASRAELREVLKLVWRGKLTPVVDKILPLSEAKKSHEILARGEQFGKIVLRP